MRQAAGVRRAPPTGANSWNLSQDFVRITRVFTHRKWFVTEPLTTCFFGGMMANFDINVFIIALKNSYGARLISYNADRAPYDIVRCSAGHRPMLLYTDAGCHPYDMWPRKRKLLKILRCQGYYLFCRWCANHWNRTMSVLFVTIA